MLLFQSEGKDVDFRAFDVLWKIGIGAVGGHAGLSSGHDSSRILYPVEDTVVDLLSDIVDGV